MQVMRETNSGSKVQRPGEFFKKLSPSALRDLESMEFPTLYQPGMQLFSEKSVPAGVYIVVSGEVKLSINSSDGKRLILSIAKAGEVLGLSSVLSGMPSEMTAETLYPARIAVIERDQFLHFMARHPEVYQVVTQELSMQYKVACEQLRTVALAGSAPEKLARLLLDWSENGQKTESGMRLPWSSNLPSPKNASRAATIVRRPALLSPSTSMPRADSAAATCSTDRSSAT